MINKKQIKETNKLKPKYYFLTNILYSISIVSLVNFRINMFSYEFLGLDACIFAIYTNWSLKGNGFF